MFTFCKHNFPLHLSKYVCIKVFVTKVIQTILDRRYELLGAIKIFLFSTHNSFQSSGPLQHRPEAIINKYVYQISSTIWKKNVCYADTF